MPDRSATSEERAASSGGAGRLPFKLGYRPEFDSLRGIAVTFVLVGHAFWVWPALGHRLIARTGAFQGVDIFFVMSGFLITTLLLEERQRNGRVSFKAFYKRRALRLLPSLFFVLLCHLVYTVVVGGDLHHALAAYGFVLGYVANFASAFGSTNILILAFDQAWSLSVEEQYYLVFFPLLAFGLTKIRSFRTFAAILAGAFVLAWYWRFHLASSMVMDQRNMHMLYVRTDTRLDALLIGPAAAFAVQAGLRSSRVLKIGALVSTGYVVFFLFRATLDSPWVYRWGFTPLELAWACIMLNLMVDPGWVNRALARRPLLWIGRVSYEVYLWHLPVFLAVATHMKQGPGCLAVALVITFAGAATSYYLVSRPFLNLKKRQAAVLRGGSG